MKIRKAGTYHPSPEEEFAPGSSMVIPADAQFETEQNCWMRGGCELHIWTDEPDDSFSMFLSAQAIERLKEALA